MTAEVKLTVQLVGPDDTGHETETITIRSSERIGCADVVIGDNAYEIELFLLSQAVKCVDVRGVLK